ncbi:DUF6165 family protein [Wenxinia marina]|uniref:Uncharacterized protein n=1 Tax=Wenxinia marina DSM 24838 TaxID=1123501 RepID=A0A0D0PIB9_9RHOB|nr:DUF6165 family protein [Wenxinia marina]KIQ71126.1 hypothetical protein Wenmar_00505 [Wenxinia marina DSM 24838]GGL54637.1 hypothetical protein GCM10011392_06320 [Wenxinia marina]
MDDILVPVSAGELIDKITILRIKSERIADEAKLANVRRELSVLQAVADKLPDTPDLPVLEDELMGINTRLWVIEDDIRECEARGDFGPDFIALARAVYRTNDRRADAKRRINELLGSTIVEEKSYADYGGGAD